MNKPLKVLSKTALAAVLASTAIVPVASVSAAESTTFENIVITKDGKNIEVTPKQYREALLAGFVTATEIGHVQSNGKYYTIKNYREALLKEGNTEAALEYLNTTTIDVPLDTVAGSFVNGELTPDSTADLKVESVSAINAKEIQVTFNQAVNKTEAGLKKNYEVTLNGKKLTSATAISDIKVGEKSAILRLNGDAFTTADKLTVQVSDAVVAERYTSETFEFTSQAPTLTKSPSVTNDEKLLLTFDRPVESLDGLTLVKLDGIALVDTTLTAVDSTKAGSYEYTVALGDSATNSLSVGTHEVKLFDVADAALINPAVNAYQVGTYKVTEEGQAPEVVETAPIVESVKALNANKFEVEFDQPLAGTDFDIKVSKGNHTFAIGEDTTPEDSSSVYKVKGEGNKYIVVVTGDSEAGDLNPLYKDGEESVSLSVEITNHKSVNELLVGKKTTRQVTLSKGLGKPKADDGIVLENQIQLDLNGNATFTADYEDNSNNNIVLRDADGVVIAKENYTASILGGKLLIDATDLADNPLDFKDDKYTVEIKAETLEFAEDTSTVAGYNLHDLKNDTHTVVAVSVVAPEDQEDNFKYYVLSADNITVDPSYGQIKIDFAKEMDPTTALNIANYKLDGETLPAGSKAEFLNNKKTVSITVPEGTFKDTTNYRFQIETAVKTAEGQQVVRDAQTKLPVIKVSEVTDNTRPTLTSASFAIPAASKVSDISKVKTTNMIKLTFSEAVELDVAVTNGEKKAVELIINDVKYTGTVAVYDDVDRQLDDKEQNTDRVLIFTLDDDKRIGINQAVTVNVVTKNDLKDYAIKDEAGNKVKPGTVSIPAGQVVKVKQTTAEGNLATAQAAVDAVTAPTSPTTDDLTLPVTSNDQTVTWSSDKTDVIAINGTVTRPTATQGDATVTLTASVTVDGQTATKEFEVIVKAADASTDTSVTTVKVAEVEATVDGSDETVYNVELPEGTVLADITADDVVVTTTDSNATVTATTADNGATWTVTVTAEDGTAEEVYTVNVTVTTP